MGLSLEERLRQAGIVELWQSRTEAIKESRTLSRMLEEVGSEISTFDRLLFFHHTKEELEERRLKDRLKDLASLVATTTADIDRFWEQLTKEEPDIARARRLEELLGRCLNARKAVDVGAAHSSCQRWLAEQLKSSPGAAPLDLDCEPNLLLSAVFSAPAQAYLIPLAALSCLLEMSEGRREATWEGFRETVLYRPVLLLLLGRVMVEFRRCQPDNAFPIEVLSDWIVREHPELRHVPLDPSLGELYPQGQSEEFFAELVGLFEKLAGIELALTRNKKGISLVDRAVFWSDTPAEAREKRLREAQIRLREEVATVWLDLERQHRAPRKERWELYLVDQALNVREAVRGIHTLSKESSRSFECPLLNQEPARWQTQALINEVGLRHGGLWTRAELLNASVQQAADPAVEDEPPPLDLVSADRLPRTLGRQLRLGGFLQRRQVLVEAEERLSQQRRELRAASSEVSLWDRVNVFSQSAAEVAEQAARGRKLALDREVGQRGEGLGQEFEEILRRLHQPLLVGIIAQELKIAVEEVRAESTSRLVSKGDSEETVYSCRLSGMESVGQLLLRLLEAASPGDSPPYLAPLEALERWTVGDSPYAQAIVVLEATAGS